MAQVPVLLRDSWRANARLWTRAVREGLIASRRAGTDRAIVAAVLARQPARVLDAGCGEGWLVRALAGHGIAADGFDAEPALIAAAQETAPPGCRFWVESFEESHAAGVRYDVIVLNFAIFTDDPAPLLRKLAARLTLATGAILIQTLHPSADATGLEGWRTEAFAALAQETDAWTPMPWYYRPLDSWRSVSEAAGFQAMSVAECHHPETNQPLSLLLTLRL